jgi:acetyltransferase-like isoleucine patch superfamily enzyme
MAGRNLFNRAKPVLTFCVFLFKLLPRFLRVFIWDAISPFSQIPFIAVRYALLKSLIGECGANVLVADHVRIKGWKGIKIGNNVSIQAGCYIEGEGGVQIGSNVSIAHHSTLLSSTHTWEDSSLPIKYNPLVLQPLTIADDVWIGCACRIMGGLHVGERTILAAGAVLTKDALSGGIYGGVPARRIKGLK